MSPNMNNRIEILEDKMNQFDKHISIEVSVINEKINTLQKDVSYIKDKFETMEHVVIKNGTMISFFVIIATAIINYFIR